MTIPRLVVTGTALIHSSAVPMGAIPQLPPSLFEAICPGLSAEPARRIETSGSFAAIVDFSTLTLTPKGRNCLLQVEGELVFTGTIEGSGTAQTSALVFAPCSDVVTTPPGTFPDVFKSIARLRGHDRRRAGGSQPALHGSRAARRGRSTDVSFSPTAWPGSAGGRGGGCGRRRVSRFRRRQLAPSVRRRGH